MPAPEQDCPLQRPARPAPDGQDSEVVQQVLNVSFVVVCLHLYIINLTHAIKTHKIQNKRHLKEAVSNQKERGEEEK